MKQFIWIVVLIVVVVAGIIIFGNTPGSTTPDTTEDTNQGEEVVREEIEIPEGNYTAEAESEIVWTGSKPLLENYDDIGTVAITEGNVVVNENGVSGQIILDMNSINVTETGVGGGQERMEEHLKSEDFFAVETYPTGTFVIDSLSERTPDAEGNFVAHGTLTLKGITNNVSFPLYLSITGEENVRAQASFVIDRTLWDIRFGSGKFFDDLADNVIADEMEISFDIVFESSTEN